MKSEKEFFIKIYYHPEVSYNDYSLEVYVKNKNLFEFTVDGKVEYDTSNIEFLAVEGFNMATKVLLEEFYKTENEKYRLRIANTLSIIKDNEELNELIKIIKNKNFGNSRIPLIYRLHKFKNKDKVLKVLKELLNDESVEKYARYSISKLEDKLE